MAQQMVKLFRGTKVADIPVEQPTKFELVINLKTANAMGVTVPPGIVGARRQGDRVRSEVASWPLATDRNLTAGRRYWWHSGHDWKC